MSTMYGADIAQLRALAAQFEAVADRLDNGRVAVGALVHSSPWSGPDAGFFRQTWDGQHNPRLAQAAALLRDGAQKLRANADAQERTSAVDGGPSSPALDPSAFFPPLREVPYTGFDPNAESWQEALRWIERFKDNEISGTGWTFGDAAGLVPFLGMSSDLLGGLDKIARGEVPWHEGVDIVGGILRGTGNPVGYGIGLNLALWSDVVEQGAQVDWSPKGMQDAFNGMFNADAWKEVGHDLATKLPPMLAGDFAWW